MSLEQESIQMEGKASESVISTDSVYAKGTTSSDKQSDDASSEIIKSKGKQQMEKSDLVEEQQWEEEETLSTNENKIKDYSVMSQNTSQNSLANNLHTINASTPITSSCHNSISIVNINNNAAGNNNDGDILRALNVKPFYFTFEYYIYLITLFSYLAHGTWCVYNSSISQLYVFRYNVAEPMYLLGKFFNAKYYDELLDSQWRGYTRNLSIFIKLFTFLAFITWVIRHWFIPYLCQLMEKECSENRSCEQQQKQSEKRQEENELLEGLSRQEQEQLLLSTLPQHVQQNLESSFNNVHSHHDYANNNNLHSWEVNNLWVSDENSNNITIINNCTLANIIANVHKACSNVCVRINSQWRRWHYKFKCIQLQNSFSEYTTSLLIRITNFYGITWPLCTLYIIVGLVFMAIVHGPYFVFPLLFMFINYLFAHVMQHRLNFYVYMGVVWLANLLFLYAGMKYSSFNSVEFLKPLFMKTIKTSYFVNGQEFVKVSHEMRWHQKMRWQSTQGLTMLRIVAFHYDKWEACHSTHAAQRVCELVRRKHDQTCIECAQLRSLHLCNNYEKKDGNCIKKLNLFHLQRNDSKNDNIENGKKENNEEQHEKIRECKDISSNSVIVNNKYTNNNTQNEISNVYNNKINGKPCISLHSEMDWREKCYKFRATYPLPVKEYNMMHYFAFMLFTPLYVSGPISTFNAFVSYMHSPTTSFHTRVMLLYTFRILLLFILNSVMLHYLYVVALTYSAGVLASLPISHQAYILYFYLGFLWMKFGFIWKSARLFAAWCGVEVPEDMRRCFSCAVSIQEFWRDWHASFNLWIVRYMYIPMGGNRTKFISIFPIFMFIAFWHDLELRLIHWALCICAAFLLELICSAIIKCMVQSVRHEMQNKTSNRQVNHNSVNCKSENVKLTTHESKSENVLMEQTQLTSSCKYPKFIMCVQKYATHYSCNSFRRLYYFLIHKYAWFILTHLSHSQRVWLFRFARSWAAAVNSFLLIIANLIGFSVQHAGTSYNLESKPPSQTEHTIAHGLAQTSWSLRCGIVICLYCAASISIMHRDAEANTQRRQRLKYHLQK